MGDTNKLGELLKARRETLGLIQRELSKQIGVGANYIAFVESGRGKPSLKLVARIADMLGVDRQELLVLAHPEARTRVAEPPFEPSSEAASSWQRFIQDHALLTHYHVTKRQLEALEHLRLLGTVLSAKEFLAVPMLIRDIPEPK